MFGMFGKCFTAITRLFSALDHGAAALENLAKVGEIKSSTLLAEAQHEHDAIIKAAQEA